MVRALFFAVAVALSGCGIFGDAEEVDCPECNTPDAGEVCDDLFYVDGDGDGFGAGEPVTACEAPEGHVGVADDCDDENAEARPGGTEVCDGLDNDCNGEVDEGCELAVDVDGDGYCPAVDGIALDSPICAKGGGDCDDEDAAIYPGAPEACGSVDMDCDGALPEISFSDPNRVGGWPGSVNELQYVQLDDAVGVVWEQGGIVGTEGYFATVDLEGNLESGPFLLGRPFYDVSYVGVAADPAGDRFVAAYVRADTTESPWSLYYQLFDGEGAPLGLPVRLDEAGNYSEIALAVTHDSRAVFLYEKTVSDVGAMHSVSVDLDSGDVTSPRLISTAENPRDLMVEWDENEARFLLVSPFNDFNQTSGRQRYHFTAVDSQGRASQQTRDNIATDGVDMLGISFHRGAGKSWLLWTERRSTLDLFIQEIDPSNGSLIGPRHTLRTNTSSATASRAFVWDEARSRYVVTAQVRAGNTYVDRWMTFDGAFVRTGEGDLTIGLHIGAAGADLAVGPAGYLGFRQFPSTSAVQSLLFDPPDGGTAVDSLPYEAPQFGDLAWVISTWNSPTAINALLVRSFRFREWMRLNEDGTWDTLAYMSVTGTPQNCQPFGYGNSLYCLSTSVDPDCPADAQVARHSLYQLNRYDKLKELPPGRANRDQVRLEDWQFLQSWESPANVSSGRCAAPSRYGFIREGTKVHILYGFIWRDELRSYAMRLLTIDLEDGEQTWVSLEENPEEADLTVWYYPQLAAGPDGLGLFWETNEYRGESAYRTQFVEIVDGTMGDILSIEPPGDSDWVRPGALTHDGESFVGSWSWSADGEYTTTVGKLDGTGVHASTDIPDYTVKGAFYTKPGYVAFMQVSNPLLYVSVFGADLELIDREELRLGRVAFTQEASIHVHGDTIQTISNDFSLAATFQGTCQ